MGNNYSGRDCKNVKEKLLEEMSGYTFSNSGKAPLEYDSLRTYSTEALRYIYTSVKRNHNFVDVSTLEGKEMPDGIDILTYSFRVRISLTLVLFMATIKELTKIQEAGPVFCGR